MNDEFNWLDYAEEEEAEAAPVESAPDSERRGLLRFRPRLPRLPRLPSLPRPRLPRFPRFWRRSPAPDAAQQSSVSELIGGQVDRPLEELDDRLQALRQRSASDAQPTPEPHQALYNVDEVLVSPEILQKPGIISGVALSKAQQEQVELLKDIVGSPLQTEQDSGRGILRPLQLFSLSALPRLVGSSLLLLVVALPFVSSDFGEGELPPPDFGEDRPNSTTVYNLLDNLTQDDYVLLGFEYGPASAGELDLLADVILRHIFAQRAKPILVSSNPIAIVHAQNIIGEINRSVAAAGLSLENNTDYFLLRYLPGGALGLRDLSENFADVARVSSTGGLTGLEFTSLQEMTLIVLIAESAEDVRNWAEQVLPEVDKKLLLVATGYAAQPLAQAYADSSADILGVIAGIRDAYTYGQMMDSRYSELDPAPPEQEPVVEPVSVLPAPQDVATPARDDQAQAELPAATLEPTAIIPPTATSQPTATAQPTNTPVPPTPTLAPTDTPAPTATTEIIQIVEVTAPQLVNIRRGPTTVDDILAVASAGDTFEVIGQNADASWYQILLDNGLEGWIAQFLVEVRTAAADQFRSGATDDTASAPREHSLLRLGFTFGLGKNRPRFYQAQQQIEGDHSEFVLRRDRTQEIPRLEAMTLGTMATVLVIVVGNLLSAARALTGRRRERQSATERQ